MKVQNKDRIKVWFDFIISKLDINQHIQKQLLKTSIDILNMVDVSKGNPRTNAAAIIYISTLINDFSIRQIDIAKASRHSIDVYKDTQCGSVRKNYQQIWRDNDGKISAYIISLGKKDRKNID